MGVVTVAERKALELKRLGGRCWHRKLIERLAKAKDLSHPRPALLSSDTANDLDETRRLRNRATRNDGHFDAGRTGPSLDAAKRLSVSLAADAARFEAVIDPN